MPLLKYSKWEKFNKVIKKAIIACENSNIITNEHFPEVRKTLDMPNNAIKEIIDYKLARYACYLIAQMVIQEKNNYTGTNLFCNSNQKTRINGKRI